MGVVRAVCIFPYKVGHFFSNETPLRDLVEIDKVNFKPRWFETFEIGVGTHVMSP